MNLGTLRSLQQSQPLLLRHLDGYVELAGREWSFAKTSLMRRMQMLMLLVVAAQFTLLLLCMLVIAMTWDGPYRVSAIGILAVAFATLTVVSVIQLKRYSKGLFVGLRREWREDRSLVQEYLFSDSEDDAVKMKE